MFKRLILFIVVAVVALAEQVPTGRSTYNRRIEFHQTIGPLTISTKLWSNLPEPGAAEVLAGGEVCEPDESARVHGLRTVLKTTDQSVTHLHVTGKLYLENGEIVNFDEYVKTLANGQFSWVILGAGSKSKPRSVDITVIPMRADSQYWPPALTDR